MGVCFLYDTKLYGERILVGSSITPRHSNVPNTEKIVELIGDKFVVIVTPADHICKKCTSLLFHKDELENDLKLVKNTMLLYIYIYKRNMEYCLLIGLLRILRLSMGT